MAKKQAAKVKITVEVPQGMIRWVKDNTKALAAHCGTDLRTPKQYFEEAIRGDFDATLDSMRFDKAKTYREYGITFAEETPARIWIPTETYSALEKEAKKQNLSVDDYVQKRLVETPVVI
jgi:hypothetical protein